MRHSDPRYGGVAQLGEHLPCKQGVMGSIPIISTSGKLPHQWSETDDLRALLAREAGERRRDTPKTKWAHSSGG